MSQSQIVRCPHCGASYQLTADYLAQYGGLQSPCHQCRQPFAIPRLGEATAGPPPLPVSDNRSQFAPVPVLGYRGANYNSEGGMWREGTQVVVVNGTGFPCRCIKCNETTDGVARFRRLYWHHPAIYIAIISPLIYIILALVLRKTGTVTVYLCPRHASHRRWFIACAWLSVPAAVAIFVAAGCFPDFAVLLVPLGITTFIAAIVVGVIGSRIVVASRIDNNYIWVKGAGPAFLTSIS